MKALLDILVKIGILVWTAAGAYFGLAGYFGTKLFETTSTVKVSSGANYLTYDGLSFRTRQDLADYLLDETASKWFLWLPDIPADIMPLLACSACGLLGAALRLVYSQVHPSSADAVTMWIVLFTPILGAGVAVAVYLLAFLLPAVLTIGPHTMRAETLVALSVISGIGCERVYQWVQEQVVKLTS